MKKGMTRHLLIAITACVIGSAFQHGYNVGVTNAPQVVIVNFINETKFQHDNKGFTESTLTLVWSVAVSIFSIGGMFGGLLTAFVSDRYGRKKALLYNNSIALVASVLFGFSQLAKSYEMFIIGRFIIGINAGLNSGLAPMYLTEISPTSMRGAVGSTYQLVVTISILLSQVLGLPGCLGNASLWPLLLALISIPAIIQLLTLTRCPESPKYILLHTKDEAKCTKALQWLYQTNDVNTEMDEIRTELEAISHVSQITIKDLFANKNLRKPLIISGVIMLSQQLSGINTIMSYSTDIFSSAGLTNSLALAGTLIMGGVNVLMTIVSIVLVERAGRRSLYIIGLAGLAAITIILTVCLVYKEISFFKYSCIVLIFAFVMFFASGIGSIPWFIVSELFDQSARGSATSISVAINWIAAFLVTLAFLPLKNLLGDYVFLLFTGLLLFFLGFTIVFVPETKNKTIEEIQAHFSSVKSSQEVPNYKSTQQLTEVE